MPISPTVTQEMADMASSYLMSLGRQTAWKYTKITHHAWRGGSTKWLGSGRHAIGSARLGIIRLGSGRHDSARPAWLGSTRLGTWWFGSTRLSCTRLGSTLLSSGWLGSAGMRSVRLGLAQFGTAWLGLTRHGLAGIDSAWLGSARDRFGLNRHSSAQLGSAWPDSVRHNLALTQFGSTRHSSARLSVISFALRQGHHEIPLRLLYS